MGSWWPVATPVAEHPGWSFGRWEKEQAMSWKTTLVVRCRFGWVGHGDNYDVHNGQQPFLLEITRTLSSLLLKPYQYTGKRQSRRRPVSAVFAARVHHRHRPSQGNALTMVGTCRSWEEACQMVGAVDPGHHLARLGLLRYARSRWLEIRPCRVDRNWDEHKISPPRVQPLCEDGHAFSTMDAENVWRDIEDTYGANGAHVTPGDGRPPFAASSYASLGPMSFAAWLARMLVSTSDTEPEPY